MRGADSGYCRSGSEKLLQTPTPLRNNFPKSRKLGKEEERKKGEGRDGLRAEKRRNERGVYGLRARKLKEGEEKKIKNVQMGEDSML